MMTEEAGKPEITSTYVNGRQVRQDSPRDTNYRRHVSRGESCAAKHQSLASRRIPHSAPDNTAIGILPQNENSDADCPHHGRGRLKVVVGFAIATRSG